LAKEHGKSLKWVKKKLDENDAKPTVKLNPKGLVVVADTTFFSRQDGLAVFREPNLKKNVWWSWVAGEGAESYSSGKTHLERNGFTFSAVVLDGRPGIREVFEGIPVQMCQFHQKQIVRRYLTNRPKLEAGAELKEVARKLTGSKEEDFTRELRLWKKKWGEFLKQKTVDLNTGKRFYTHKRIRSAYNSLKKNLPYLFTFQKYPELNAPNTTNSLDGFFNRLKSLTFVHRGLKTHRRNKVILEVLKGGNA
jgi:hypothetical protein